MILLAQLAVLTTVVAQPLGTCHVQVLPADAPRAWMVAAFSLQRQLSATTAATDHDCRAVVIRAAARDASVEVTTGDGRHAVRAVADAGDVAPTVAALIVTLPIDVPAPAPPAASNAGEETTVATPASPERPWRLLVYAGGGARLTLPRIPAPVVELMAGTIHRQWELALFAGGARAQSTAANFTFTGELALAVARRRATSFGALIAGGRAGVLALAPNDNQEGGFDDAGWLAPAMTGFVGSVVHLGSFIRLRPQLAVQWIPKPRAGGPDATSSMWNVGLSVGAEGNVP